MSETSRSVADWSRATFGAVDLVDVAKRAAEEMDELRVCVVMREGDDAITDEIADVVIVLCRLADECGVNLWDAVERKMAVNRQRQWRGWHHVSEKT